MHLDSLSAEQSLVTLNISAIGLEVVEASHRLAEFGLNHVEEVVREHLQLSFARDFRRWAMMQGCARMAPWSATMRCSALSACRHKRSISPW